MMRFDEVGECGLQGRCQPINSASVDVVKAVDTL